MMMAVCVVALVASGVAICYFVHKLDMLEIQVQALEELVYDLLKLERTKP